MDSPHPRRTFLQRALGAALAAHCSPLLLGATDKAGSNLPRVGRGEHTYECHHDWGMDNLPEGHHYGGATHGVAMDSQSRLYVTHHGRPGSLFVFDDRGRFIRSLAPGHRNERSGEGRGHGVDIRMEDGVEYLYLSPDQSPLPFTKMTLEGEIVWEKDREALAADSEVHRDPRASYRPTNIGFRPDGGYYLGDGYGSNHLFEFDGRDRFVRTIGGPGSEEGRFRTPHGQWLDQRDGTPKLVVADRANKRLQWFDMDGRHLRTQGGFLFPADIDTRGDLMLVPDLHARITLLGRQGAVIAHLGDDPRWRASVLADGFRMRSQRRRWLPGRFVHPHDACFDARGNIFVAEWVVTGRLTLLRKVG